MKPIMMCTGIVFIFAILFPTNLWCQDDVKRTSKSLYEEFERYKQKEKDFLKEIKEANELENGKETRQEITRISKERRENWGKLLDILKEWAKREDPNLKQVMMDNLSLDFTDVYIKITDKPQFILLIKYGEDFLAEIIAKERVNNEVIVDSRWLYTIAGIVGQKNIRSFCRDFMDETAAGSCTNPNIQFHADYNNHNIEKLCSNFFDRPYKIPEIDFPTFKKRFQKKIEAAMKRLQKDGGTKSTVKQKGQKDPFDQKPRKKQKKKPSFQDPKTTPPETSDSSLLPWILSLAGFSILSILIVVIVIRRRGSGE